VTSTNCVFEDREVALRFLAEDLRPNDFGNT